MPVWENYEINAETHVSIRVEGQVIGVFTTYGATKATSNEDVNRLNIPQAVSAAIQHCETNANELAKAIHLNRRREIGYRDGN